MQTFQKQETILVWSEVQFGVVLLTRPQNRTLSVGLLSFQGQFVSDQGAFFANLVIGTFSIVILFLIFQRYVTRGITLGAQVRRAMTRSRESTTVTRIERIDVQQVDLEPATVRIDAMQSFVKQETVLVTLHTSDGLSGTGYSYTIGTGGRAVVSLITDHLVPALLGRDARPVEALWRHMHDQTRATTVGPITSLAFAAVDIALWDLRGRRTGESLWKMAGGAHDRLPVYDTEGGWLHLTVDELVIGAKRSAAAGMRGVKVKVGRPLTEDAERLAAVRAAVGPGFEVMVDANQAFTSAEAIRRARTYEPLGIAWFEEPLPADDLHGHRRLAAATPVPVAVGESLYSVQRFGDYLAAGAVGIVQADVARIGGITPWLKVAHAAEAFNIAVSPHFLMELHVSLAAAVPNGIYVEHIPQLQVVTRSSLVVADGCVTPPDVPGIGIDWDPDALDDHRVA